MHACESCSLVFDSHSNALNVAESLPVCMTCSNGWVVISLWRCTGTKEYCTSIQILAKEGQGRYGRTMGCLKVFSVLTGTCSPCDFCQLVGPWLRRRLLLSAISSIVSKLLLRFPLCAHRNKQCICPGHQSRMVQNELQARRNCQQHTGSSPSCGNEVKLR